MSRVRLLQPDMPSTDRLVPYLRRIEQSGHYTNFGPLSLELEAALGGLVGATEIVAVSSATIGLELTLAALGLPASSEVLVPAHTFVATAAAVVRAGHRPVLADIDPESCLLTTAIARAAASGVAPRAVVPVGLYGAGLDAEEWDAFSVETGIPVVIDAAGAVAVQRVGRFCHAVYSLHATKALAAGEGGFLATHDALLAARVRSASNFGFSHGRVDIAGTNGKLSEYHAAVGLASLEGWEDRMRQRQAIFDLYAARLAQLVGKGELSFVSRSGLATNLTLRLGRALCDADERLLAGCGIEFRRWYWPPLDRHPAFAACRIAGSLDGVASVADRQIGVPFHLGIGEPEIELVAAALEAICA
jgi:dTDP-4-amino-4,6-dideoxygalactose transaminase